MVYSTNFKTLYFNKGGLNCPKMTDAKFDVPLGTLLAFWTLQMPALKEWFPQVSFNIIYERFLSILIPPRIRFPQEFIPDSRVLSDIFSRGVWMRQF